MKALVIYSHTYPEISVAGKAILEVLGCGILEIFPKCRGLDSHLRGNDGGREISGDLTSKIITGKAHAAMDHPHTSGAGMASLD